MLELHGSGSHIIQGRLLEAVEGFIGTKMVIDAKIQQLMKRHQNHCLRARSRMVMT